jgi:precorrin-6B methylase 1
MVYLGDKGSEALAESSVALGMTAALSTADNAATLGEVRIALSKSTKTKCARCWKHKADGEDLCTRCAVVTK